MAKTPEEIQALNLAAQEFITTISSMAASLKDNAKEIASQTGEAQQKSIVNTAKARKLAEELKTFTKEQLKDRKTLAKFENKISDTKSIQAGIEAEIQELLKKSISNSEDLTEEEEKRLETLLDSRNLFDDIVGKAEDLKETLKDIDREVEFFDDLADATKSIPGLGKAFGDLAKAQREAAAAGEKGGNKLTALFKGLAGTIGKATIAFGIGAAVKGLAAGQKRITEFSQELNISRGEAQELNNRFVKLASNIDGITARQLAASTIEMSNSLGIAAEVSNDTARAFTVMTERLGVSSQQAAKLTTFTSATGENLKDFNNSLVGNVSLQNEAAGTAVRYQDVMKDIADAGGAVQLTTSKFPGGIQKAAFEARRLGLNFTQLANTAQSLLNFEDSIGAELEAELLTGKELNLEKARMAALTGDNATLAAELAKNFGSAKEFQEQNVIAQEAQAKAMGMTRDELAETLMRQEAIRNLSKETGLIGLENMSVEERVNELMKTKNSATGENFTKAEALEKLGEKELARQEKNQTLQDKMATSMEKLADATSTLAKFLDPIGNAFDLIARKAGEMLGFVLKIGSKISTLGKIFAENLTKPIGEALGGIKGFGKFLGGGIFKAAGGATMKSVLKKIPVLGLIVGIGLAVKRIMSGDFIGGLLEVASGVASLFPGIGTAVSVGLDLANAGRDMYKAKKEKEEEQTAIVVKEETELATGGIVRKPTRALVGEAGAEAVVPLNQFYAKMDEMIAAIREGGDVFIDGNKAGMALNLGAYRSSTA